MDYTGNGIQNWFLKEIELFIYYVKGPLRGHFMEIPKNHTFSPWIGNTCLCIAYDTALKARTAKLKRIVHTFHDQTCAFRVGLKEIIVPSSIKKQALVELYSNQDYLKTFVN